MARELALLDQRISENESLQAQNHVGFLATDHVGSTQAQNHVGFLATDHVGSTQVQNHVGVRYVQYFTGKPRPFHLRHYDHASVFRKNQQKQSSVWTCHEAQKCKHVRNRCFGQVQLH